MICIHTVMMHSKNCPECGEEMEEVVGFEGYVWCRDCHVTKKVQVPEEDERPASLIELEMTES